MLDEHKQDFVFRDYFRIHIFTISCVAVAVVGLEQTFYNVSEDVGIVEVCAVVYEPVRDCPISFPFELFLSTEDGSAGRTTNPQTLNSFSIHHKMLFFVFLDTEAIMDYNQLTDYPFAFDRCELRQCVDVAIRNDLVPEDLESFFVNLERTPGLSGVITLTPVRAEIEIIDANSKSMKLNTNFKRSKFSASFSGCGGSGADPLYSTREC